MAAYTSVLYYDDKIAACANIHASMCRSKTMKVKHLCCPVEFYIPVYCFRSSLRVSCFASLSCQLSVKTVSIGSFCDMTITAFVIGRKIISCAMLRLHLYNFCFILSFICCCKMLFLTIVHSQEFLGSPVFK